MNTFQLVCSCLTITGLVVAVCILATFPHALRDERPPRWVRIIWKVVRIK